MFRVLWGSLTTVAKKMVEGRLVKLHQVPEIEQFILQVCHYEAQQKQNIQESTQKVNWT